jgi:hypothetical protein
MTSADDPPLTITDLRLVDTIVRIVADGRQPSSWLVRVESTAPLTLAASTPTNCGRSSSSPRSVGRAATNHSRGRSPR